MADERKRDAAGTTKPIAYAPPPAEEPRTRVDGDVPLIVSDTAASGGTKPIGYAPGGVGENVDPQGYIVRGFSPTERESLEVPRVVLEDAAAARARFGDRAGEHEWIPRRAGVSARSEVIVAFVLLSAIVGSTATFGIADAAARADVAGGAVQNVAAAAFGAIVGLGVAFGCFHDRWRCIEAFASRYVRGGVSHVWATWLACGYGVWRGIRKLGGR